MKPSNPITPSDNGALHLLGRIEAAFQKAGISTCYQSVGEIIATDEDSAAFIREVLTDSEYTSPQEDSPIYQFAKSRAQHSVLTFFVGLVFLEFCDFEQMIARDVLKSEDRADVVRLWMLTALYHDWGYHSEDVSDPDLDYAKIVKYPLLTDAYEEEWLHPIRDFSLGHQHILAYTYDEIMTYDRYARDYHAGNNSDKEKVDHGILGGVKIFDRLAKRIRKDVPEARADSTEKRLCFAKIACLTIAQHNIFKSSSAESDLRYGDALKKLHSTSDFRINMDTPLLLLLSLVDTFECIKRFGQSKNERAYLQKNTILQSIALEVSPDSITIDYTALAGKIQDKDDSLRDCFNGYKRGICGIGSWTAFAAERVSEERIVIQLKA